MTQGAEAATPKSCPSCGTRYPADALFCSLDGAPLTTSPGAVAAAAASDPNVGREILGHIEIRQLVGIGAMGRVYRAFQKGIDRDVAVKILHRELSANHTLVARFHREARVASRLAHPNVVHVLLTGQLPDGALYIVMEYLDGLSLQSAVVAAGGDMPLPRALHIALQLCDAAGEAHAQGVVHRDLKPENVMLVRRGDDPDCVKVLDFGIARLNWGEQSMATAAGLIFGTARYISPEGARGEKVSPQGDVYSIATMVYQMLAGRTPFDGEQAVALLVQQIHDPPPPLRDVPRAAHVPEPIAAVVMQNLAKRAEERADNARAFGRSLLEAAVQSGLSAQDLLTRPSMFGPVRGTAVRTVYEAPAEVTVEPRVVSRTEVAEPPMVRPSPVESTMDDRQASSVPPATPITKPPSAIESTLAGDDAPFPLPGMQGPTFAVVVVCVLVGALATSGVVYRMGLLGKHTAQSEPGIASVRALPEPTAEPSASTPVDRDPVIPALASAPAGGLAAPGMTGAPSATGATRAMVDVSDARPGVGQPVDLAARIQGGNRPKVEGATFHIAGPDLPPGTHLTGIDDGSGVFRATFTFVRSGRFEVAFTARADGVALRAAHVILVGEINPLPGPASPSSLGPAPAPSGGTKWL